MSTFLVIGALGALLLLVSVIVGDFIGSFELGNDLFGGAALSGFLGAFGFGGAIAHDVTGGNTTIAVVVGVIAGILVGLMTGWVIAKLRQGDDGGTVRMATVDGRPATVVDAIPVDGYGSVSLTVAGHITRLNARSSEAIPAGTVVVITSILSSTAVSVERLY